MRYTIIDKEHEQDINLKNEPFLQFGRMIPTYIDQKWGYSIQLFSEEEKSELCFPDENYDFDKLSSDHLFIGAYDGDACVGVAILKDDWFKYMYLDDLKVSSAYRHQGVGAGLIEASMEAAKKRGYNGLYTIGQDDNLAACKFYLKMGFEIGGFDNRVYKGTSQESKANIFFYKE